MDTIYYKVVSPTFRNRDVQYTLGLNEYTKDIDKPKSGLYFCEQKDIGYWLRLYHNPIICEVVLCPNSIVYTEYRKLKTDRFLLQNPLPVREFLKTMDCMRIVLDDGLALEYMDQTPELCMAAVKQNGRAIQFVFDKTFDLWSEAWTQNGRTLEYMDDQTQCVCLLAVRQNGLAMKFVKLQDNSVCMMAVHQNGLALKYIENPSPYVVKIALEQNGFALQFVKDQTDEHVEIAKRQNPLAKLYQLVL